MEECLNIPRTEMENPALSISGTAYWEVIINGIRLIIPDRFAVMIYRNEVYIIDKKCNRNTTYVISMT